MIQCSFVMSTDVISEAASICKDNLTEGTHNLCAVQVHRLDMRFGVALFVGGEPADQAEPAILNPGHPIKDPELNVIYQTGSKGRSTLIAHPYKY